MPTPVRSSTEKRCSKCKRWFPYADFRRDRTRKDGFAPWCTECRYTRRRKRYWENAEENREKALVYKLKKEYGLTRSAYNAMLASQGHVCAICGRPESAKDSLQRSNKRLAVDHDHNTGDVRGLLCYRCNMGLGYFNDDPAVVAAASAYLLAKKRTESAA